MPRSKGGIWAWLRGLRQADPPAQEPQTSGCTHVILLDGTMSSLSPGHETNIGLTYRLLKELPPDTGIRLYYEPGIQWRGVSRAHEVMAGIGINRQIRRAYVWLSQGWKPGDRVVLMGYSRGSYAVRSLGGFIDRMGLMRTGALNQQRVEALYDLYREDPDSPAADAMRRQFCGDAIPIAFLGVYDTVRALGIRWPVFWRMLPLPHPYHNHALGPHVVVARHALALDETRVAYAPVLWNTNRPLAGQDVVQMWFAGSHGDIGGHLNGHHAARPRSNLTLNWMLAEAEAAGLYLPEGWTTRFPADADAPSVGTFGGFGKLLWMRRRRRTGQDPSEAFHPTVRDRGRVPVTETPDPDATPAS
ncbi:DUF2235 domain-containing protein [Hasllibacter sp. MH4015]|uniref:DUF2235 domain-containing protein n=1 Tax=Hasllibacter sp. MH4015 TaxID=2854029 RepID=UPI001CD2CD85|nr:DUF2235 domain-containing protein [Hasllibacter sp. MH4015]